MLPKETIDELAKKFNANCVIASGRYDEPKYAFAAVLTMAELLLEREFKAKFNEIEERLRQLAHEVGMQDDELMGVLPNNQWGKGGKE